MTDNPTPPLSEQEIADLQFAWEPLHEVVPFSPREDILRLLATIAARDATIAALKADLKQCRKEKTDLVLKAYPAMDRLDDAIARAEAAEAEAKRLREAAKSALLVLCAAEAQSWHENMAKDFTFAIEATRAALAPQTQGADHE